MLRIETANVGKAVAARVGTNFAKRLDVPLTFLLEGSPAGAIEACAIGYCPADFGPDQRTDVDLLQASVLVQQRAFQQAVDLLALFKIIRFLFLMFLANWRMTTSA